MKTKKRSWLLAALVGLMVMALGVGSASAASVVPYDSWCTADINNNYNFQENEHHAYAGEDTTTYAESRVDGWQAGAQAHTYVDPLMQDSEYVDAYANASFSQQFKVNAPGSAKINFAYEGSLSEPMGFGSGTIYDGSVGFDVYAWDTRDNSDEYHGGLGDGSYTNNEEDLGDGEPVPYNEAFSLDYTFTNDDVYKTFTVNLQLDARVHVENVGSIYPAASGSTDDPNNQVPDDTGFMGGELAADFYNTAEITNVEGVIEPVVGGSPVPIPGAALLLGSGLFGLVAIRRRKKTS